MRSTLRMNGMYRATSITIKTICSRAPEMCEPVAKNPEMIGGVTQGTTTPTVAWTSPVAIAV